MLEQTGTAQEVGQAGGQGRDLWRNIAAGGMSSLFKAALQLAMLPVMGRLLGPHEFGLYATVLPIVTFFTVTADGGLGASLAKERSSDRTVWNTAFYVMLALGVALALAVNASGIALALFMQEPRLQTLMAVLSVTFLFIAVSTLPSARLFQRNDLVSMSAIDMAATAVGAVTAIVAALRGFGAMSLAIQSVTTYGVRAVGLNARAFEVPGRAVSLKLLASHVNTGGVLVGSRLVDMACRFVENILFSLAFGPTALGTYTFANQISRFLCESASNPIWSATYAQTLRVTVEGLKELLCAMARLMMLVTFPAACILAVSSHELIPALLGAKWQPAVVFLQILVCSYALSATATMGGAAFLATGEYRLFLGSGLLLNVGRVAAVAAGPWIGAVGAVLGVAAVQCLYALVVTIAVGRCYALPSTRLARYVAPAAVAGIVGALVCAAALHWLPGSAAGTLAGIAIGGLLFVGTLVTIDEDMRIANVRRSLARLRVRAC